MVKPALQAMLIAYPFALLGMQIVDSSSTWCSSNRMTVERTPGLQKNSQKKNKKKWNSLFDGKTLKGWKKTNFGGEGEVSVESGKIVLEVGSDMTGIHTDRKLPKNNYEVRWEAQRVDGSDFFCGFTFPVGKEYCSLIAGGWGGGVCGLSSIDEKDASENNTTSYRQFKNKKWYRFRLRVTDKKIVAWMNGKKLLDQKRGKHKFSLRSEIVASKPFGFATWQSTGAIRKIELRKIPSANSKKKSESNKTGGY